VIFTLRPKGIGPPRPGCFGFQEPGVLDGESGEVAEGVERIGILLDETRRGRPTDHDQAAERSRALAKGNGQDRERFARGDAQGFMKRVIGHVVVDDRPVFLDRTLAEGSRCGVALSHDPLKRTAGSRYQEFPGTRFQEGDGRPGAVEQLLRALRDDGQDALEVLRLQDRTARLAKTAETSRHVAGLRAALATHSARGLGERARVCTPVRPAHSSGAGREVSRA
jgi:hypothetical protein